MNGLHDVSKIGAARVKELSKRGEKRGKRDKERGTGSVGWDETKREIDQDRTDSSSAGGRRVGEKARR